MLPQLAAGRATFLWAFRFVLFTVIIRRFNKVTQAKPWGSLVLRGAGTCQNFLPPHCAAARLGLGLG